MDAEVVKYLSQLNQKIRRGCTAHITKVGRLYYMNHETKTSSWLPPVESWDSGGTGLPYGWEAAFDRDGKTYFINHVNRTTTCEDPRKDSDEEPPLPRDVELIRDSQKGFGFVAGSEKPVIVRFVTEGGPSEGKLLPGDQILQINNEDVMKSPRERVIQLVRSCKQLVNLKVCQPCTNNTTRKSALLTAAKKAKLKSNPSRVRFAEGVVINGSPLYSPSPLDSSVPFMPNVLKVFLENGQTKSFKYDGTTTVQDVLNVLQEKLSLESLEHFSLVVEHIRAVRRNKLSILNPKDTLAKIAARPGAHNLRCLFRITFVPKDVYEFMQRDPVAFDYLFVQCCNDVVHERFAPELKYDVALRLAALHLQQHALISGTQGKLTVKTMDREYGLEKFVPISLLDTMKRKELLKLLSQLMKQNQALSGPGQKQLSSIQAKFHYLKIVSELPSYGAKSFITCTKNSAMGAAVLVGPRIGVSEISTIRNIAPLNLCQFGEIDSIEVTRDEDFSFRVKIHLRNPEKESLNFNIDEKEIDEFVLVLERYYHHLVGETLPVEWEGRNPEPVEIVPSFHSRHTVQESPWSYVPPAGCQSDKEDEGSPSLPRVRTFDLSIPPPSYIACEERQLSRSNSRDQFSIATSPTSVDHNMNEMRALVAALSSLPNFNKVKSHSDSNLTKEINNQSGDTQSLNCENECTAGSSKTGTIVKDLTDNPDTVAAQLQSQSDETSGIDMHSVVSMELLEESDNLEQLHERSNDVINRVTEMSKIVTDAEKYLLCEDVGQSTSDLATKCQDSLLFIRHGVEEPENLDQALVSNELVPSESEAESTPTNSPNHCSLTDSPKTIARKMCSSFGLHSPHLFASMDQQTEDVEELLRQLQASTDLPLEESTLCLDPDIIDLTIVPPPNSTDMDFSQITPDVDCKSFLNAQPDDSEETGESRCIRNSRGNHGFHANNPGILFPNSSCYDGCFDQFSASTNRDASMLNSSDANDATDEDDLAAYIIPPPPSSSVVVEEQNRVLARFKEAAEEVRRMMSHDGMMSAKYVDSMNSVSKFCTMPRRHDDSHRPSHPSLASIVTPIREKTFAATLSAANGSGLREAANNFHATGPKLHINEELCVNGIYKDGEFSDPPQRPPRVKKTHSGHLEATRTAENTEHSIANGVPNVNGSHGSGFSANTNGQFTRTFSIDSFRSSSFSNKHSHNQACLHFREDQAILDSLYLDYPHINGGHDVSIPRVEMNGLPAKLSNGHDTRPYVNGHCNGFNDLDAFIEPSSLPTEVFKECDTCFKSKNGLPSGCVCGKLGQFKSYHQSLPRSKILNSGFQALPITIINNVPENNHHDDNLGESGVFYKASHEIAEFMVNLDATSELRLKECSSGPAQITDPIKLVKVRETLMSESRQFVTASKLFVKSITESSDKMEENLSTCLSLLDRIFAVSELVVMEMNKPCQIVTLVEKLKEMALAYSRTVSAAHFAASGEIPNPNMAGLMHQATSLATSLTTLMRTLRTFHTA